MRSNKFFLWLFITLSTLLAGCGSKARRVKSATPPTAAATASTATIASKAFDHIKAKTPLDEDRHANAYIVCVTEALIHDRPGDWEIAVFRRDSPDVFVLPGGKIGVHTGLLRIARNQHQLAAVLSHALAHAIAHHPEQRISQQVSKQPQLNLLYAVGHPSTPDGQLAQALFGIPSQGSDSLPFDRGQEREANVAGLDLMANAGFNPRESLPVWWNLDNGKRAADFVAIHPSYGTRKTDMENHMSTALHLQEDALAKRKKPDCDRLR